jgi:hypothetical protein
MMHVLRGLLVCTLLHTSWASAEAAWRSALSADYIWSQVTATGSLLVSTEKSLLNIDPETGATLWERQDMADLAPFNVRAITGTPLLLVNEHDGAIPPHTQLQVINIMTGESLWDTGRVMASNLIAIPVPAHDLVLYAADHSGAALEGARQDLKPGTYITGFELSSGKVLYDSRQDLLAKAMRHPSDTSGSWIPDMDLSGHQAPVIEGDIIYLPFVGVTAMNLKTGEVLWETPFKTTTNGWKLTAAPLQIVDDVIYASGDGKILALNKLTGETLWETKVGRKYLIPELLVTGDQVLGRIGGTFSNGKDLGQVSPFGVVALNRADGSQRWLWKKAKKSITNMAWLEQRNWVVVADRTKLYALDLSANKKPVLTKQMELEFKRAMGTTEMAAKGMSIGSGLLSGGLMGGLQGGLKAMDTSSQEDPPTALSMAGDDLIVRGQYHLLSYDEDSDGIEYSIAFAPPGMNGLALVAMGAATAFNTLANTGLHSSWARRDTALDSALGLSGSFEGAVAKRYAASQQAQNLAFFLTTAEEGLQLVGINLDSGEEVGAAVPMAEKEPQFMVDGISNRVYYIYKGTEVRAFNF